jgi:hypothetical protein
LGIPRPGSADRVKSHTQAVRRSSNEGAFRVIPQHNGSGEEVFVVVSPTGIGLYTFTDLHLATAEAAELNLRL